VVLHVDKQRALDWSDEEVVERWMQLYKGDLLVDKWLQAPDLLSNPMLKVVKETIEKWRERLYSIEWFMRGVNETIARMANEEENCKGRFWEGRYKSQALLDEVALLSCMAYVDLNPVRAGMADDLEGSDFTSIQQRIHEYALANKSRTQKATKRYEKHQNPGEDSVEEQIPQAELMEFDGSSHTPVNVAIPFSLVDYFELVDSTGRVIRSDKKGHIPDRCVNILEQLGVDSSHWIEHITQFGFKYASGVGSVVNLNEFAALRNSRWAKGIKTSERFYLQK